MLHLNKELKSRYTVGIKQKLCDVEFINRKRGKYLCRYIMNLHVQRRFLFETIKLTSNVIRDGFAFLSTFDLSMRKKF